MALEDIKVRRLQSQGSRTDLNTRGTIMQSWALVYTAVVLLSASCCQAFPLYSGASLVPQADMFQRVAADIEEAEGTGGSLGESRGQMKGLYPLLLPQGQDTMSRLKGTKDSIQQEKLNNVVEDVKAAVLKLAALDRLRTHSLFRSEQNPQKTDKRACFWKYCVTN
ncbi:urotensin-related peptide 1 [Lepisosteus oculatus]|uniref:urotensin-related peptide 1 n=1 Tax=Lepisosteus oculatus TaxID=7918 RepID=UPI0037179AFD